MKMMKLLQQGRTGCNFFGDGVRMTILIPTYEEHAFLRFFVDNNLHSAEVLKAIADAILSRPSHMKWSLSAIDPPSVQRQQPPLEVIAAARQIARRILTPTEPTLASLMKSRFCVGPYVVSYRTFSSTTDQSDAYSLCLVVTCCCLAAAGLPSERHWCARSREV